MSGPVGYLNGLMGGALLLVVGCASSARTGQEGSHWLVWQTLERRIELRPDHTALCTVEEELYRGNANTRLFKRSYVVPFAPQNGRYLEDAVAGLMAVELPRPSGRWRPISIAIHRPPDRVDRLSLDSRALDLYPVWHGVETQLTQLVQLDLLYGTFYREIAESSVKDGDWEQASRFYLRALADLVRWADWKFIQSEEPYIDDSELLLTEPQVLHNNRRYHDSVAKSREAWSYLARGVVVTDEGAIKRVTVSETAEAACTEASPP